VRIDFHGTSYQLDAGGRSYLVRLPFIGTFNVYNSLAALAAAVIHGPEILFLDEPFEGVDAVAATTLKRLLQRFISHGGTVFLTSHVLEVVERLCSHIGIIQNGRLVASGSLEELRAGVQIAGHDHSPLTLEEIFLQVVGGAKQDAEVLSWL
jgi:ABC-2 type transport system ATP-binding protein